MVNERIKNIKHTHTRTKCKVEEEDGGENGDINWQPYEIAEGNNGKKRQKVAKVTSTIWSYILRILVNVNWYSFGHKIFLIFFHTAAAGSAVAVALMPPPETILKCYVYPEKQSQPTHPPLLLSLLYTIHLKIYWPPQLCLFFFLSLASFKIHSVAIIKNISRLFNQNDFIGELWVAFFRSIFLFALVDRIYIFHQSPCQLLFTSIFTKICNSISSA